MMLTPFLTTALLAIVALLAITVPSSLAFSPSQLHTSHHIHQSSSSSKTTTALSVKATLTEETTWRLRFSITNAPTSSGRSTGELFNVDVKFVEEPGYEPPQGTVTQIPPSTPNVPYLKIQQGRWKLSEDPDDRKDGLWIWGLFSEPLYPFLLLSLQTEAYQLITQEGEPTNEITPMNLYAQVNHSRDKDSGVVELGATALNLRQVESIKADPFGAAQVEIFDDVKIGQISVRPLVLGDTKGSIEDGGNGKGEAVL